MKSHSPFHVVEDFLSPLSCERIAAALELKVPNRDENGTPLKYERLLPDEQAGPVLSGLSEIEPLIERRYGGTLFGPPALGFQQYSENPEVPAEAHTADGWKYSRKKWTKVKDVDLVGFVWLKSYHASVPLDPRFEVYGGKLEFPGYNFSLVPVRGTLVLFPATPHFVHAISHILVGSLSQIKISMRLRCGGVSWQYDPAQFPGTYQDWLVTP